MKKRRKKKIKKDPFETLGLKKDATPEEIKKAYRKLSKKHHPDTNKGSKESHNVFVDISIAFKLLTDPDERKMYDERGYTSDLSENELKAQEGIFSMFSQYVDQQTNSMGFGGMMDDPRKMIENKLRENLHHFEHLISEFEKQIVILEKFKLKIQKGTTKAPKTNLLEKAIEAKIRATDEQILPNQRNKIIAEIAIEYIQDYEFSFEDRQEAKNNIIQQFGGDRYETITTLN